MKLLRVLELAVRAPAILENVKIPRECHDLYILKEMKD
jgi:hypothetical protein